MTGSEAGWKELIKQLVMRQVDSIHMQPKIQLDEQFEWVSDEFRDDMNQWLLEMFGEEAVMMFDPVSAGISEFDMMLWR